MFSENVNSHRLFIRRIWTTLRFFIAGALNIDQPANYEIAYRIAGKFGGEKVWRIWQIVCDSPN